MQLVWSYRIIKNINLKETKSDGFLGDLATVSLEVAFRTRIEAAKRDAPVFRE